MTIGQRIRQLRKERKLNQSELAQKDGHIKQAQIAMWETDRHEPTVYHFYRICKALEISMDEFMKGVDMQ